MIALWLIATALLALPALALFWPRPRRLDELKVGGRYRIGRRRVVCTYLGVGSLSFRSVGFLDVDTKERAVNTYHKGATFPRRRFGP